MTTEDPKISQRYRELPSEEPPRHVDEAILAAARRAVVARPAPLVVPSGRRRWYFPLAAAAIIVLAVAVTMHVERERPDEEIAVVPVTAPKIPIDGEVSRSDRATERAKPSAKAEVFAPDPEPKPAPSEERVAGAAADSRELPVQRDAITPAPRAAPSPPAASPPPVVEERFARRDAAATPQRSGEMQQAPAAVPQAKPAEPAKEARMREEARVRALREPEAVSGVVGARLSSAYASPEQWLQGIADLRRQGRHDEADKALAEFRRVYPDYKISEAMLEKVEKK